GAAGARGGRGRWGDGWGGGGCGTGADALERRARLLGPGGRRRVSGRARLAAVSGGVQIGRAPPVDPRGRSALRAGALPGGDAGPSCTGRGGVLPRLAPAPGGGAGPRAAGAHAGGDRRGARDASCRAATTGRERRPLSELLAD